MEKNNKGFTLVELIISIMIIAVILLLSRTIYTSVHSRTVEKIYAEKIKTIEAAANMWAQNNQEKITVEQVGCPEPKNFDSNYTYKCYKDLTVGDLLDAKYLKSDNNFNKILDPRDKTKDLNDYKIIVYYYYNNYYAEVLDENYMEATPVIEYFRVNNASVSAATTTSRAVNLYIKGRNATSMCFSNTNSSDSCMWKNYYETAQYWTLTAGYGTKTIYGFLKNNTGQIASTSVNVEYMAEKAVGVYLRINDASITQNETYSTNVTLYPKANHAVQMCFKNTNSSDGCVWKSYSETGQSWMLTSGYGMKTVYAFFKNDIGEISLPVSNVIEYTAPSAIAKYLRFNNSVTSAVSTNSQNVTLYTKAENATQMCFSNTNNGSACTWMTYNESGQSWTLTSGYGMKTVYVFFKNTRGFISESFSATISYESDKPTPKYLRINNATTSATTTNNQNVTLYAKAESATQMCFSNTNSSSACTWITYNESGQAWTLTSGYGSKTVYVFFRNSGNIEVSASASINYIPAVLVSASAKVSGSTVGAIDGSTGYISASLSGTCQIYNNSGTIYLYVNGTLKTSNSIAKVANGFATGSVTSTDSSTGKGKTLKVECVPSGGSSANDSKSYNVVTGSTSSVCGVNEYNTCEDCSFGQSSNIECFDWGDCCSTGTCRYKNDYSIWYDGDQPVRCKYVNGAWRVDYCESYGRPCLSGTGAVCGVKSYNYCYHY